MLRDHKISPSATKLSVWLYDYRQDSDYYQDTNNLIQDTLLIQMGKRMAMVRENSGLKQIPFAEALEVSQASYNTYERGQREIPVRVLRILYNNFGVSPVWMMTGEGRPYKGDNTAVFDTAANVVKSFIEREKCQVEPDKYLKLVRFLMGYTEQHGEINVEIAEEYLRSAI